MSENKHTPEPWPFGATPVSSKEDVLNLFKQSLDVHEGSLGEYFFEIFTEEGKRIAFLVGPTAWDNARRIVACVNALQGVPTEQLEQAVELGITDVSTGNLFSYRIALQKQRDELLAACKRAETWLDQWTSAEPYVSDLRAAIAAAQSNGQPEEKPETEIPKAT